jgi:hypothetical protein
MSLGRGTHTCRAAELLVLALCFGTESACRRAQKNSVPGVSSEHAASSPALTKFEIKSPQHDFGAVVQGDSFRYRFEISNSGSARLELEGNTAALGCAGVVEPRSLELGATGQLTVACQAEFYGPLRVTLPIRSSGGATVGQVELMASVTPLLAFDPPLVSLRMPFGEERSVDVRVQGALTEQARLTLKDAGDAGFSVTPLPAAGGAPQGLRLRVRGKKVGVHVGNIVLTTNLPRPRELTLPYSCEVAGSLVVSPSTPYFDLRAPGAPAREIAVHSSQPGFSVRAVRVAEGPFSASFARRDAGNYTVTVSVEPERITSDARATLGRLLILSNDRAEPEKELPLFAFGAVNHAPAE